ncbi:sigma-54 interaction domain-containing protein [Pseudobacillus wudalianchiensis]|uniref:HTH-type transcriptional regulatory protein TyrR n=1 Tax=Pseudobacillus wudalianchiensis TaxID=1743143 RepID=A0A1B9ADZ1_9BACI|nr:sigma 54-interacting transcriptional regulator [Bacillus wudalianchiensis]OCA82069.1 Fis family transcriptional regulator [Bacillus wudalianchiensis]
MEDIRELELRAILAASNDNIVITDGDGVVLRASPSCLSIYGEAANKLIGVNVEELEQKNIFSPSVTKKVLQEKKEVQLMQYTSTGRIVMATALPVFNDEGEIVRVISFSHDLTEIQHLKEDYEELRMKMAYYQSEIKELREKEEYFGETVMKSKEIRQIWQLIQRVAKSDATVVFLGESGVGKNVFARAVHEGSRRQDEVFIEVNCSAIPESLFESEMFGYERGAFTGANREGKAGLIETANGGTLFLDEVGELPLALQVKLLKVIQEKRVTRIGGTEPKTIDFRIIASTNRDLEQMVKEGKFRRDLFYRLNVIPINIPSLRERKEDVLSLCNFYLKKFNEKYESNKIFHVTTINELLAYEWPGNVRELENLIERLVVTTENRMIYPQALPFYLGVNPHPLEHEGTLEEMEETGASLRKAIEEVEIRWLRRAARQYKTTYEMADYLGISQSSVVRKLNKYQINS